MKDACPELAVPASLPVNERQTSTAFAAMMAQDPDAPVRNAPGSHLRGPGATGIAAAQGRDGLSRADLARFLAENDGFVLTDTAGARHVLVLGEAGDELWLLGEDGRVADTAGAGVGRDGDRGPLRAPADTAALPDRRRPPLPSDERAVRGDAHDRPAGSGGGRRWCCPSPGGTETVVRLAGDGMLAAEGGGTGAVPGTWRWSRGELVVTLEGTLVPGLEARYPWQVLADRVGTRIR